MENTKLNKRKYKKCPFCGNRKYFKMTIDKGISYVMCLNCNAIGPSGDGTAEQAYDNWNTRMNSEIEYESKYDGEFKSVAEIKEMIKKGDIPNAN